VVNDVASPSTVCYVVDDVYRGEHRYTMRWMTWRAPVHYVVDDVASNSTLWWMTRRAPVNDVVDDVASTGTLWGG
jgi:hypothetical protein